MRDKMDYSNAEKVVKIIIRCLFILRVLILLTLVILSIRLGEIAELLKHMLYHQYGCCRFH